MGSGHRIMDVVTRTPRPGTGMGTRARLGTGTGTRTTDGCSVQLTRIRWVCAALAGLPGQGLAEPSGREAPFGFAWGPVSDVPRPSMTLREGNITALVYLADRTPPGLRDTEEVVLEVCASEGLQHIIWVSRPLPDREAQTKYLAALAVGTQRYGAAEKDPARNAFVWRPGRTTLAWAPAGPGQRRLVMMSAGPEFEACSNRHLSETGHAATKHTADLWPSSHD